MSSKGFCLLCGVVLAAAPAAVVAQPAAAPTSGHEVTCDPVVAEGPGITSLNCKVSGTGIVQLEANATLAGASPRSVMTIAVDGAPCASPSESATAAAKVGCRSVYVKDSKVRIVLQHGAAALAPDSMKLYAAPIQ